MRLGNRELTSALNRFTYERLEKEAAMTIEMLVGGFVILMMVAIVVVTMTSTKNGNTGNGGFENYEPKSKRSDKRR